MTLLLTVLVTEIVGSCSLQLRRVGGDHIFYKEQYQAVTAGDEKKILYCRGSKTSIWGKAQREDGVRF